MKKTCLLFVFVLSFLALRAQPTTNDSARNVPMVYLTYAYQINGGDIALRFGNDQSIGGGFQYKTKSNWLFGFEYNYLFGGRVKDQDAILSNISTSDGNIIGSNGEFADIRFVQAGYNMSLKFGKIFPVWGSNKNSGIMVTLQPGFMQHRIKINNSNNTAPQLKGDYKKGYDELANGFSATEFVGYMYMGKRRIYSFYAGFEFTQGFTKCRRAYNFNTMTHDTESKLDLQYSFRFGWLIPFSKRNRTGYYY